MIRTHTLAALLACSVGVCSALGASTALAASPDGAPAKTTKTKPTKKTTKTKPTKPAPPEPTTAAKRTPADRRAERKATRQAGALLRALRAEVAAAQKAGKPSDVVTPLLSAALEVGLAQQLSGYYALAAAGHALRTGGMPAEDVKVVAADLSTNAGAVAGLCGQLAAEQAFKGPLGDVFGEYVRVNTALTRAADALARLTEAPGDDVRIKVFGDEVEALRRRLKSLDAYRRAKLGG